MRFRLEFSMENAAFADAPGSEICRILRNVEARVMVQGAGSLMPGWPVFDRNGNKIGTAKVVGAGSRVRVNKLEG